MNEGKYLDLINREPRSDPNSSLSMQKTLEDIESVGQYLIEAQNACEQYKIENKYGDEWIFEHFKALEGAEDSDLPIGVLLESNSAYQNSTRILEIYGSQFVGLLFENIKKTKGKERLKRISTLRKMLKYVSENVFQRYLSQGQEIQDLLYQMERGTISEMDKELASKKAGDIFDTFS